MDIYPILWVIIRLCFILLCKLFPLWTLEVLSVESGLSSVYLAMWFFVCFFFTSVTFLHDERLQAPLVYFLPQS